MQVFERTVEIDRSLMGKVMGAQANYRSDNRRVALKRDLVETLRICEDLRPVAPAKGGAPLANTASANRASANIARPVVMPVKANVAEAIEPGQALQPIRKPTPVAYVRRYRHPALSRPVRKIRPEISPTGLRAEADLVLAFVVRSFAVPEIAGLIIKCVLVVGRTFDALRSASGDIEWRPAASPFGPQGQTETTLLSGR